MKKYIIIALALCCLMLAGCGMKTEVPAATAAPEVTVLPEATAEPLHVVPLPQTLELSSLSDCIIPVSFTQGDAYVDDSGAMQLKVQVYAYDLYDMVDMSRLQVGDSISILGKDVVVESLEKTDGGDIVINGDIDQGGHLFSTDDSGVYFERGFNDAKSYYAVGEAVLRVSADFVFTDSSDLDNGVVEFYPGDFLIEDGGFVYHFVPSNTTIRLENGEVVAMERIYIP